MARVNRRRVLCFAPLRHTFADLCASVRRQPWVKGAVGDATCAWHGRGLALDIDLVETPEQVAELVSSHYYNLVLVDARNLPHPDAAPEAQARAMGRVLDRLRSERDLERRYPRRRVVVLVGDADPDRADRMVFAAGQRQVGACLRDHSLSGSLPDGEREAARDRLVERLFAVCQELLVRRRHGRKAICAAGGGITGMYYELGVLKCLNDVLSVDVCDFDLFFGISAGAVVTSGLANRIPVDQAIARLGALDHRWQYRLELGLRHLNVKEVPRRIFLANRELLRTVLRMLQRQQELSLASVLGVWAVLLGPIFESSEFEEVLAEMFSEEGRTNDFRQLGCRLFVGATDQDRREHVLFGEPGLDDVPISKAVQASMAMHPFFPSVEIKGRYFSDGVVTRTSNLRAAIDKGADLIFVVDPFVPLISDEPGLNARHGNMWIFEQDLKTMSYTRFEQARDEMMREHPRVSVYTFVPSNRMRRLMSSQNPFVSRNFHPIVCEAYRSTLRRLETLDYRIRGDLASHGIGLDFAPARVKEERLKRARRPHVSVLLDDPAGSARGSSVA